jgi:hypothetical protein
MAGKLSVLGEVPEPSHSRSALEAIGAGERTFGTIANRIGAGKPIPSALSPLFRTPRPPSASWRPTPHLPHARTRNPSATGSRIRICGSGLPSCSAASPRSNEAAVIWSRRESNSPGYPGEDVPSNPLFAPASNSFYPTTDFPAPRRSATRIAFTGHHMAGNRMLRPNAIWKACRCIHVHARARPHHPASSGLPQRCPEVPANERHIVAVWRS